MIIIDDNNCIEYFSTDTIYFHKNKLFNRQNMIKIRKGFVTKKSINRIQYDSTIYMTGLWIVVKALDS